jgi:hypothetical protein
LAAALGLSSGLASAQGTPKVLPAGTPLTFVADDFVNTQTVRPGSVFKVHLLGNVVLDGTTIAAPGTTARLIVIDRTPRTGGGNTLQIAIEGFKVRGGELPVALLHPVVEAMALGTEIPTKTMGTVEQIEGRTVIRVPLPFLLPADVPNGAFTPIPAQTAQPRVPPARARTPTPPPTPVPSPSASSQPGS